MLGILLLRILLLGILLLGICRPALINIRLGRCGGWIRG